MLLLRQPLRQIRLMQKCRHRAIAGDDWESAGEEGWQGPEVQPRRAGREEMPHLHEGHLQLEMTALVPQQLACLVPAGFNA